MVGGQHEMATEFIQRGKTNNPTAVSRIKKSIELIL